MTHAGAIGGYRAGGGCLAGRGLSGCGVGHDFDWNCSRVWLIWLDERRFNLEISFLLENTGHLRLVDIFRQGIHVGELLL